ncbi:hypothetical protein Gogos_016407 [Gossypium gossypioides]|uniref:Uncharacterized protein n=1 Tax=Gossypium gossypioides TaxID=34282 RepID=A0A7J9B7I5_GOSGO|nr:hypothetical protein [Gossypium gossypioides]
MLHQKRHSFSRLFQVDHGEALQLQLHHGFHLVLLLSLAQLTPDRHHRNFLLESSQRFHHHSKRRGTGKRYYGDKVTDEDEARELREVITETFRNAGTTNRADFFPVLNWLGGYKKKEKKIEKKLDGLLQKLVDEQRWMKLENNNNGSVVDHLLNLQQSDPHYYIDEVIKELMLVLILAGTDTTLVTMEWAMSNLRNHPKV